MVAVVCGGGQRVVFVGGLKRFEGCGGSLGVGTGLEVE
jgi:hypothetical protein